MTHTPGLHLVRDQQVLADEKTRRLNNAAPDMLRALEAVCGESEESDYLMQAQIQAMCRSAIQKARGEE